jgi:hypothetical protein
MTHLLILTATDSVVNPQATRELAGVSSLTDSLSLNCFSLSLHVRGLCCVFCSVL